MKTAQFTRPDEKTLAPFKAVVSLLANRDLAFKARSVTSKPFPTSAQATDWAKAKRDELLARHGQTRKPCGRILDKNGTIHAVPFNLTSP